MYGFSDGLSKMTILSKALSTLQALTGFFSCVGSLMQLKETTLSEAFSTVLTLIGFLSHVGSLMQL